MLVSHGGQNMSANGKAVIKSSVNHFAPGASARVDELWTIDDLVRYTKLSLRKIQYDVTAGAISCCKFGRSLRFKPEDVSAYVESRRISRRK